MGCREGRQGGDGADPAGQCRIRATTARVELRGGVSSLWKKDMEEAFSEREREIKEGEGSKVRAGAASVDGEDGARSRWLGAPTATAPWSEGKREEVGQVVGWGIGSGSMDWIDGENEEGGGGMGIDGWDSSPRF